MIGEIILELGVSNECPVEKWVVVYVSVPVCCKCPVLLLFSGGGNIVLGMLDGMLGGSIHDIFVSGVGGKRGGGVDPGCC